MCGGTPGGVRCDPGQWQEGQALCTALSVGECPVRRAGQLYTQPAGQPECLSGEHH